MRVIRIKEPYAHRGRLKLIDQQGLMQKITHTLALAEMSLVWPSKCAQAPDMGTALLMQRSLACRPGTSCDVTDKETDDVHGALSRRVLAAHATISMVGENTVHGIYMQQHTV